MIDDRLSAGTLKDPEFPEDPLKSAAERRMRLVVEGEAQDQRLDLFLVSRFSEASRSAIQRAINQGNITVNGKGTKPSCRLTAGDTIEGEIPDSPPIIAVAEEIPLAIVYEDDEIIVIDKPSGMVTHPGAGATTGTLANALVYHLTRTAGGLPKCGGTSRPGIVHRLDVGTSGLIVAAKTDRAHLHLAAQFEARTVFKSYTALVHGSMKEEAGAIDAPIGRDPRNRVKMAVTPAGRHALTLFRVIERFEEFSLLKVEIKTGRTHQIRVHLAYHKHPVVGDPTYDAGRANGIKNPRHRATVVRLKRPFLHAARLSLIHPVRGEKMEFASALPANLENFLSMLRASV
ncbi:MAG: RluA family pseudouridine synthase [Blastocatellia bacterium]